MSILLFIVLFLIFRNPVVLIALLLIIAFGQH